MHSKSELFNEERNDIVNKILKILEINDDNNTFYLHELDNNIEKQEAIFMLESDIKNFFAAGSWACFANSKVKRKELSIIRNVLKEMNYDLVPKRKVIKKNNEIQRDTLYYIIKN